MVNKGLIFLFDWGGVLAKDDSLLAASMLAKKYSCNYQELLLTLQNEDPYSISEDYSDYLKNIEIQFSIPASETILYKTKTPPNKTLDFCHYLHQQGHTLYLLSDQMHYKSVYIKKYFDISCFSKVFFSSEIGYLKTQTESFIHVLENIDKKPSEIIFVDDNLTNIQVATALGIESIHYTNLSQLKKQFSIKGIHY